jgi:hypothetical protein
MAFYSYWHINLQISDYVKKLALNWNNDDFSFQQKNKIIIDTIYFFIIKALLQTLILALLQLCVEFKIIVAFQNPFIFNQVCM